MFPIFQPLVQGFYVITPEELWFAFVAVTFVAYVLFRTQKKTFYIVRHGRTTMNDEHIKQGDEGGLSEAGKLQAQALGVALAQVRPHIHHIYSSPFERAKETSKLINAHLHARISYTKLLAERRNPKEVIGRPVEDPEVLHITGLIEKGFHDNTYRFSDEENFVDLSRRARRAARYLGRGFATQSCVVTHHAFLHMFLSSLLYGKKLDAAGYAKLAFFNPADNAGITICEYTPWKYFSGPSHGWEILAYNQTVDTH